MRLHELPNTHASLSFTISESLLKLVSTEWVMPSNHLILHHPLLLLSLIIPSHRVLSNLLALCIRWSKYWSFIFSISPSKEYSVLISFSLVWFDLLAVQGTLMCLPKCQNLKASILQHSALFIVQLCTCLVFCFPSSWIPLGCTAGHGHSGWWLQHPLSTDQQIPPHSLTLDCTSLGLLLELASLLHFYFCL